MFLCQVAYFSSCLLLALALKQAAHPLMRTMKKDTQTSTMHSSSFVNTLSKESQIGYSDVSQSSKLSDAQLGGQKAFIIGGTGIVQSTAHVHSLTVERGPTHPAGSSELLIPSHQDVAQLAASAMAEFNNSGAEAVKQASLSEVGTFSARTKLTNMLSDLYVSAEKVPTSVFLIALVVASFLGTAAGKMMYDKLICDQFGDDAGLMGRSQSTPSPANSTRSARHADTRPSQRRSCLAKRPVADQGIPKATSGGVYESYTKNRRADSAVVTFERRRTPDLKAESACIEAETETFQRQYSDSA